MNQRRPTGQTYRNLHYVETLLARRNIKLRREIRQALDDLTGVNLIGEIRASDMYWALDTYSQERWNAVFQKIRDDGQEG